MAFPTYKITFKRPGPIEGDLKAVVVYIRASGADTAIADARQELNLRPEDLEAVEAVVAPPKVTAS